MSSLNQIYKMYNIEAANKFPRSVLNLTCIVHSPEVPAAIFWKHNGQVFFRLSYHIFTVLMLGKDPATKSDDFLEKCQRRGGSFSIPKFMLQILGTLNRAF